MPNLPSFEINEITSPNPSQALSSPNSSFKPTKASLNVETPRPRVVNTPSTRFQSSSDIPPVSHISQLAVGSIDYALLVDPHTSLKEILLYFFASFKITV